VAAVALCWQVLRILWLSATPSSTFRPAVPNYDCPSTILPVALQVSLPDLQAGVAAAREADVFIGMHGGWGAVHGRQWAVQGSISDNREGCSLPSHAASGVLLALPCCAVRLVVPAKLALPCMGSHRHSPQPPAHLAPGANLANGWMMRPGSSVIELIPYQFETGRGAFVFSVMNGKVCPGTTPDKKQFGPCRLELAPLFDMLAAWLPWIPALRPCSLRTSSLPASPLPSAGRYLPGSVVGGGAL